MHPDFPGPGPGGRIDLPVGGTGLVLRVRGTCGPDEGETEGVTFLRQVHGTTVLPSPSGGEEADGMVFPLGRGRPGLRVADCLPLFAVSRNSVAAAHCGWRGIAGGIAALLLDSMPEPPDWVMLGPRICPDCFQVDPGVRRLVLESDPGGEDGHPEGRIDLGLVVRRQISGRLAGCPPPEFLDSRACTCHGTGLFHSWRRDRTDGRNLAWLCDRSVLQKRSTDAIFHVRKAGTETGTQ
jgi:copper oxidase (laccase) domain-containing protein